MATINDARAGTLNFSKFSKHISVLDELTHPETGEHCGYLNEGGYLSCAFIMNPLPGGGRKLMGRLDALFENDYPDGSFIQVTLAATPFIADYMHNYHAIRGGRCGDKGELDPDRVNMDFADYIQGLADTSIPAPNMQGVPLRNFEVWLSFKMPISAQRPKETEFELFNRLRGALSAKLKAAFGDACPMIPRLLTHRMQMLHNPSKNAGWRKGVVPVDGGMGGWRPGQLIRNQYMEIGSEIEWEKDHLKFSSADGATSYARSISVQEYAEILSFGDMYDGVVDWLAGGSTLPGNFMITLNVEFDALANDGAYNRRKATAKHLGTGPLAKWFDGLRYNLEDYMQYDHYLEKNKAKHTRAALNFMMFADTVKQLDENCQQLEERFKTRRWRLLTDANIQFLMWRAMLPMELDGEVVEFVERFDMLPSNLLKFLAPVMASWKGNAGSCPVMTMIGRDGQLATFNPFISETNYNIFISATSGAGKSFTANAMIENILSSGRKRRQAYLKCNEASSEPGDPRPLDGGRVYVIDSGRSYLKLCHLVGGQFVEVYPDESFAYDLNPWRTIEERFIDERFEDGSQTTSDGSEPVPDGVKRSRQALGPQGEMLLNVLKLMAFPMADCDSFQLSAMSVIMCDLWKAKGNKATIDDFADECAKSDEESVRRISKQLIPWCRTKGGQHGWMFNSNKPPIQFEKSFVVLELDGLNGSDQVKAVTIMLCMQRIQQQMFGLDKAIQKMFMLDEAWEFLKESKGSDVALTQILQTLAKFLESGWRRFRKYGSAGVCITQSIRDAYQSPAGIAMATNSAHMMYLKQNEEQLAILKNEGSFSSSEIEHTLLSSVHKDPNNAYSEVMIRTNGSQEIFRLFIPPAKAISYSTNPVHEQAVADLRRQGYSTWEACQIVSGGKIAHKKAS